MYNIRLHEHSLFSPTFTFYRICKVTCDFRLSQGYIDSYTYRLIQIVNFSNRSFIRMITIKKYHLQVINVMAILRMTEIITC